MENAAAAISKVFAKAPAADQLKDDVLPQDSTNTPSTTATADKDASTTVDAQVAAPVEHTHVKKQHETREQVVVDKDIHKDHYHTTVQPLKDSEVLPEKHDYTQETKTKAVERDDGAARAKAERDAAGLKDTKDVERSETAAREPTEVNEHVHHHVHETVVPVVEKEVIDPSVTHKRVDVKEKIHEASEYHGVTKNAAVPIEDFEKSVLSGDKKA